MSGTFPNGDVSYLNGTTYQSVASFICNPGYKINGNASASAKCASNGKWSYDIPTCIKKGI